MKVGIGFIRGDWAIFEEVGTEAVCVVIDRREHGGMVFYDLSPIIQAKWNKRGLSPGTPFTVGIRLDCADNASWSLRNVF
ncbi:hypothetical protein IPJ70_02820 [Candidatus Campbellbacteria bacterium]|nr:MAG: hypothetical protein IPJ70_02820 [Candidatus Campbellbacteria bacterium]